MKVTIHQPYYIPYMGFFSKVFKSDILVLYDTAQYVKNRLDNRNYIICDNQKKILTVPIAKHMSFKPLSDVLISNHYDWKNEHLALLEKSYNDHPYYKLLYSEINDIYSMNYDFLSEINSEFIIRILSFFGWSGEVLFAKDLDINSNLDPSEKILELLQKTNAEKYIAGPSSEKYLDFDLLERNDITVEIHHYRSKEYNQPQENFVPNLSVIDYIFNCGFEDITKVI